MVGESSGRNESERRNGLETGAPEAEPSFLEKEESKNKKKKEKRDKMKETP
jgi:hypothetical protein